MTILSIIMPCWLRPQRTARAIRSVLEQTDRRWELLCVGDNCPELPGVMRAFVPHDRIAWWNMAAHEGKYGTHCLNSGINAASGEYVCFLGNDDYLLPDHVEKRLAAIDGTGHDGQPLDVVHCNAILAKPSGWEVRSSESAQFGTLGGSELIVRTSLARKVGFTSGDYGHDWIFWHGLLAAGARVGYNPSATYVVTSTPGGFGEAGID